MCLVRGASMRAPLTRGSDVAGVWPHVVTLRRVDVAEERQLTQQLPAALKRLFLDTIGSADRETRRRLAAADWFSGNAGLERRAPMRFRMESGDPRCPLAMLSALPALLASLVLVWASPALSTLSSYALTATDDLGPTGVFEAALSVPDYQFVNDVGLGFGGVNTDVFETGESTVLTFTAPLQNVPAQDDLIVYAYVGGLGATDNATVSVEASSDGLNYIMIGIFDTSEARIRPEDVWENDFAAVKKFAFDFGTADLVTHIRLTNLASTIEGLRLDAVEGLHPYVESMHAFELRLQRVRENSWQQFRIRIKNIADPGGVAIRGLRIINSPDPLAKLERTDLPIESVDGDFICIENCLAVCTMDCGTPPPRIPFARYVWSTDGLLEAAPGLGLAPGYEASHFPALAIDTDSLAPYLSGYSFEVIFVDGVVQTFDYDADFYKELGRLYEKYLYFSSTPALSWDRPADFYEFVDAGPPPPSVPGLGGPIILLLVALFVGTGSRLIQTRRRLSSTDHHRV